MYRIGKIVSTHGIKGEVKVLSTSDFKRFVAGKTIYYYDKDNQIFLNIESVRNQQELFLIKFKGFDTLTAVEPLKGVMLFTDERPELKRDEYIKEDLINLLVYSTENELIGRVVDLRFLPTQELLVVENNDHKKIFIPLLKEFVISITDKIIVKVIEGLI